MIEIFSLSHFLIIIFFIILPIFLVRFKLSYKALIFLLLFLEILRLEINLSHFEINEDLSLQLCFIYPFIGVLSVFFKSSLFRDYLGSFGWFFGVVGIVFSNPNPLFSFSTLHLYFYHSLMILISFLILKNKITTSFLPLFIVLIIQIFFTFMGNFIIGNGCNYMFLNTFLFPYDKAVYKVNIDVLSMHVFGSLSYLDILDKIYTCLGGVYYVFLISLFSTIIYIVYIASLKIGTKKP